MLLDFSKIKSIEDVEGFLKIFKEYWQLKILHFIKQILNKNTTIKVKTSGSIGIPKELYFTKEQLFASAKMTGGYFSFSKNKLILLCLSVDFIAGKMQIVRAIYWKMKLLCVKHSANPLINISEKVFFASLVPYQLKKILKENPAKITLINNVLVGGAPIDTITYKQIEKLPINVYESFGMTETITHFAIKKLNGELREKHFSVLKGIKIKTNKDKCLIVEVPFLKEVIISKDLVYLINNHQFNWLGRYGNLINSGGIKLIPELLENKIKHLIHCPFFFISFPDKILGEMLVLVVEDSELTIAKSTIKFLLHKHLSKYEIPKKILKIKRFCRTKDGKIKRNRTRDKLKNY